MEIDRLFIYTLRDLEQSINSADEYEVLMSAALLRKLLLDGSRLADQVNRAYRLDLRFRISSVSPIERSIFEGNPVFWTLEDALDPECPFAYKPYSATRDQFLARRIMRFNGHWITVRDVIDQLANVEGAVHSGHANNDRRKAAQAVGKFYNRSGLPGLVSQMRTIGRITLQGLSPLRDAIIASGSSTWATVSPDGSVLLNHSERGEYESD